MKKTFKFVVSATMEWPESEMTEQRAHDYILSAIRDCYLNKLIEDCICDCEAEVEEVEVEDAGTEETSESDRALAMLQMEQELIEIVKENGEDGYLDVEDIGMAWTEECDGDCCTKGIFALAVKKAWDEDEQIVVHMHGEDELFVYCDHDDLGHNLADYIYNKIKAWY